MDRASLARQVREVLAHLNNRSYLAVHPLAWTLGGDHPLSGDELRGRLADAVEQLRPVAGASALDPVWRQYRHLTLRYVDGRGRDEIAQVLGVSARQASRDHERAVEAVTELLWVRSGGAGPDLRGEAVDVQRRLTSAIADAAAENGATDVGETLRGVLATLDTLLAARGVVVRASVPDTLPPVVIPRALLRQVLLNLLTYVAELVPTGEVQLVGTDAARGSTIRVLAAGRRADADPGPASPVARELLEAGRRLLETHGGTVELGVAGADDVLLALVLPPVPLGKVLVIDDNPDVVMLFQRYLRGEPYRVVQATSGESALRLARELGPDVITLDVLLPSQDGWDTLQQLRADPATRDIPVVVCSVLPERALALSLGVTEFLNKPVTRAALLETLARCRPPRPARPARS